MDNFKNKVQRCYQSSSEFVSSGHPDRLADNLAAIIIQDIQKKDGPKSHAAVEVFITHDTIIFGGEVTTSLEINDKYLKEVAYKGFERSGYIPQAREYWSKDECVLVDDMTIVNKICTQSPDIALGTTDKGEDSGWNDQGVYFSSADNSNALRLGYPHYLAQLICEMLQEMSYVSISKGGAATDGIILGPDNKCVVTCDVELDGFTPIRVSAITIAVAHSASSDIEKVRDYVKSSVIKLLNKEGIAIDENCQWIINGTGRFVVHGPVSDTSMTGRKISVNHPSAGPVWSNKMIGGGSLVKPAHASDLILNIMSRYIANVIVYSGLSSHAVVGCAGAIGVKGIQSIFIKGDHPFETSGNKARVCEYFSKEIEWAPIAIAKKFDFYSETFDFGRIVDLNFFGHPQYQPWEDPERIKEESDKLKEFLFE